MRLSILLLLTLLPLITFSQEEGHSSKEHHEEAEKEMHMQHQKENGHQEEHHFYRHSIALMLGHSHISQGRQADGGKKFLVVPSIMLDYNYYFNEKWSIGWHNDLINENFFVERHIGSHGEETELERERPIASLAMIGYKFSPHFTFNAGAGGEFAKGENFFVSRIGFEGGWHLHDSSWEFVAAINYDIKWDAYDTWNLSAGIAKRF